MNENQPKAYNEKHFTLFKKDHFIVEGFVGKSSSKKDRFKSYFLYTGRPCRWRGKWRNIRGFYVCLFGYYLLFAVWQ